jgi:hypothetical protein
LDVATALQQSPIFETSQTLNIFSNQFILKIFEKKKIKIAVGNALVGRVGPGRKKSRAEGTSK